MPNMEFRAALQKWVETMPMLDDALKADAAAGGADTDTSANPAPPETPPTQTTPTGGEGGEPPKAEAAKDTIDAETATETKVDAPPEKPRDISVHTAEGAHEASLEMRIAQNDVRIKEAITVIGEAVQRVAALEAMIQRFEHGIDLAAKVDIEAATLETALELL